MDTQHALDVIIVVLGAILGSAKASAEFDANKEVIPRLIDITLGVFVGVALAYHYGSSFGIWLCGLVALIGGASGTLIIEVFLQLLPSITRDVIKRWIKRLP